VSTTKSKQKLPAVAKNPVADTPVTLDDIALQTGLSKMTVSRVLRGTGSFSAVAREKVERAVRDTGYVPNRLAGALASSRSTLVAVIVPTIGNIVFTEVLAGISQVFAPAGLQAVLGVTDYDIERETRLVETMLSWRPNALIIAGLEHSTTTQRLLRKSGIPVVQIMDIDGDPVDAAVGFSQRRAGEVVARHFLDKGYRRIGYAGIDLAHDMRAAKRYRGFLDTLKSVGISIAYEFVAPLPTSLEIGALALQRLMHDCPDLDAVYFANDDMAVGALLHCLRVGISVPGRIAMAGFNGLGIGQAMPVQLTSVRSPRIEIGTRAAEIVLMRNAGRRTRRIEDVGFDFIAGQTS
jgi:LacI family gluconate utilization system Gnt-I transcriptional repressor